jgi:hypothetical protein
MKFKFWREQPVFHIYDISYYFSSNQIIMNELPTKNKYCNFQNIVTGSSLSPLEITQFVRFIGQHYLQNGANRYAPKAENILPYFLMNCAANDANASANANANANANGANANTNFFSFYQEPELLQDVATNTLVNSSKIISVMTSRLVTFEYTNNNKSTDKSANKRTNAYYVDYLCVDKAYRKKGIAPQMIQTHEYNQRHSNKSNDNKSNANKSNANKSNDNKSNDNKSNDNKSNDNKSNDNKSNTPISLFKREGDLTGIVPITVYKTIAFNMKTWTTPSPLLPLVSLIECGKTNFHFIIDFLKETREKFSLLILPEFATILELIQTKNCFIYFLLKEHDIKAAYFFRKTCTYIEENDEVLSCYASINNCKNPDLFIHGFKVALFQIKEKYPSFQYLAIEEISNNKLLTNNLKKKNQPLLSSPTAYFFYNYISPTLNSEKVLVLI